MSKQLKELPVALVGAEGQHTLKCAIMRDNVIDGKSFGVNEVVLCRSVGVDIGKELHRATQTSSQMLEVQLGSEVVNVSTRTLSAGKLGSVSRNYEHRENEIAAQSLAPSDVKLRASVVIPIYGDTPPYLAETMRYFKIIGDNACVRGHRRSDSQRRDQETDGALHFKGARLSLGVG